MTVNLVVQPLLKEEANAVQLYASDSFINSVKRRIQYLKTHPETLIQIQQEADARGAQGATLGMIIAIRLPMRLGFTPIGVNACMLVVLGGITGGTIGYGATFANRCIQLKHSNEYLRWEAEAIQQNVLPLFKDFLSENEVIQNFLCPVTGDLITVPVRAADNATYEQQGIEHWLDSILPTDAAYAAMSPEQKAIALPPAKLAAMSPEARAQALINTSPLHICPITKAGLTYDFNYHKKLFAKLKTVYNNTLNVQFKKGLHSYSRAIKHERQQLVSALLHDVTTQYAMREISEADFLKMSKEIRKKVEIPSFI